MRIVGKNVTIHEANEVELLVKLCVNHLTLPQYALDLPYGAADAALYHLEIKKRKDTPSRAGNNLIRINLGYWQLGNPIHKEYKSYENDPIIGSLSVSDRHDALFVMIAHEVSHYVQFTYGPMIPRFRETYRKPHGDVFKELYMYLRRDLVNPFIRGKLYGK